MQDRPESIFLQSFAKLSNADAYLNWRKRNHIVNVSKYGLIASKKILLLISRAL